jgi:hypothetical protein
MPVPAPKNILADKTSAGDDEVHPKQAMATPIKAMPQPYQIPILRPYLAKIQWVDVNDIRDMPRKKMAKAKGAKVVSPPTDNTTAAPVPTIKVNEATTQEKAKTKQATFQVSWRASFNTTTCSIGVDGSSSSLLLEVLIVGKNN